MEINLKRIVSEHCRLYYTKDWLSDLNKLGGKKVFFIDTNIKKLYNVSNLDGLIIPIHGKDIDKNITSYEHYINILNDYKIDSKVTIISIGGGSVSNIAGFIAGTFKRGVAFITVPTTLLSMVDACISYKQAINTPGGKNQIGCYKVPQEIIIYKDFLKTLDKRFLSDGYAEIIKHFICENKELSETDLDTHIHETILMKCKHIQEDPYELHPILMYGHQYGHALEFMSKDNYFHGESVNIGMIATSHVGYIKNIHSKGIIKKHKKLSDIYNLPKMFTCGNFPLNDILKYMKNDKSVINGKIYFSYGENVVNDVVPVEHDDIIYGLNKVCIDKLLLPSGYEMQKNIYGTYDIKPGSLYKAIKSGYRTIDCASFYGNEEMLGEEIQKCIDENICTRSDLFIINKLWNDQHDNIEIACKDSLRKMKLEYFDLYLMHWPVSIKNDIRHEADVLKVYSGIKKLEGNLCRDTGVSNFEIHHLEKIIHLKPCINQIEYHPHFQSKELIEYCDQNKINVMAYSPFSNSVLEDLHTQLTCDKYAITPHKLILSWILNNGISVISKTDKYQQENFQSFIQLTESDMDGYKDKNIRTIVRR